jgi:GntR family transcriptional regulator of vanillate catabolism
MVTRALDVTSRLRQMVLAGDLAPGLHMTEAMLAQRMNVSRTPVRDALRILANENLLSYSPNRGYVVRRFDLKDLLDAYDVRATLEAMACRLVAEQGLSAEAGAELDALMVRGDTLLNGSEWAVEQHRDWGELNRAFHFRLLDLAGNRHLAEMAGQMRRLPRLRDPRLAPASSLFQTIYPRHRARASHQEHREIIDAIRNGQGTRAEALMREHVWRNREALRHSLPHLAAEGPEVDN